MKHIALLLPACLALTACVESNTHHHHHHGANPGNTMHPPAAHNDMMPSSARFECQNGLAVEISHLGNDSVELRLDDKRAVLQSAVSGSGERYMSNQGLFGRGAEWHQKGNDAIFGFTDPYGNKVETVCQAQR